MSAELDMQQYLDLFLQEAEEQLETLEQETLKLEDDPSDERLAVIFRAAHTLKGSSRAMGFARFAELTHEMENVLDKLRLHQLTLSTPIADALFGCQDVLRQMAASIADGKGDSVECSALVKALQGFAEGSPGLMVVSSPAPSPAGPVDTAIPEALWPTLREAATQSPILHARFTLQPDCVMKFVRALMAINIVQTSGEVLATAPDSEKLEEEAFDRTFEIVFQSTESAESLRALFGQVSEVEAFEVKSWEEPKAAALETPALTVEVPDEAAGPGEGSLPASAEGAKAGGPTRKADSGQTVRVDVSRLDNLMNLVGELVIDRTRIAQLGAELAAKYGEMEVDALTETVGHIARITSDLQDQIMKARMMPIETVFNRFPRVVRDLAQKLGKDVKLEVSGGETELDRSVIEVIGDPLLHILRNSVDHGLELPDDREKAGKPRTGRVVLSARHQENHIVIEIVDDGKGIDADRIRRKAVESGLVTSEQAARLTDKEALQFIFASGLSTAAEVTEVSGRGVGMDIVRSNIQKLGGIIDLDTTLGVGTRFSLRLPLTLAIIRGLLVKMGRQIYVLPLGSVVETLLVRRAQIQTVNQREVIVIRDVTTPLVRLGSAFGSRGQEGHEDEYVVVVGIAEQRVGLVVDGLIGEQEVVIKSLSRFCGEAPGVSGATILGDGNVALIVDVNGVVPAGRR